VETVRAIRGGESSGKHNCLCAAATAALLTATNDEWSHFGVRCADQRGDAEWSTDLGGADNKVCRSGLLEVECAVIGGLHRIDNECAAARCAPRGGEHGPRLDRANLARGECEEPHGSGAIGAKCCSLHHALRIEAEQLNGAACGCVLCRQGTSAAVLPRRRDKRNSWRQGGVQAEGERLGGRRGEGDLSWLYTEILSEARPCVIKDRSCPPGFGMTAVWVADASSM
jgi:hypothetical protein